jgi:hypothetical protein
MTLLPARVHEQVLDSVADLRRLDLAALRSEGVTVFKVRRTRKDNFPEPPVHLLHEGKLPARPLLLGQIPTFILKRDNRIQYNFVNGFWVDRPAGTAGKVNGVAE